MPRKSHTNSSPSARRAFTLIELLVVIAIIAAIMALSASAVIRMLLVQQRSNTQSTLDRTQGKLNVAWSKVKDQAYKEKIPDAVNTWIRANMAQIPGEAPNVTTGRVRVIYVKLKLRQAFPMSFGEALNNPASPLGPLPAYVTYLNGMGITGSMGANFESSACLLMALGRGVSGAGVDTADLTGGGASGSFTTPSGKALPYITDAWQQPIYFSRVPVGSIVLNPGGATPGNNDPLDPQGYLQSGKWAQSSGPSGTFGNVFTTLTLQQLAPGNTPPAPPLSFKIAPMVASSGPDKIPQFNTITFAPTLTADDLFSTP